MRYFAAAFRVLLIPVLLACCGARVSAQNISKPAVRAAKKWARKPAAGHKRLKRARRPVNLTPKQKEAAEELSRRLEENFSASNALKQLELYQADAHAKRLLGQFDERSSADTDALPPELRARNTHWAAHFRKNFLLRVRYIQNHREAIRSKITTRMSEAEPDYNSLLADKKIIFIGVHHYEPFLAPAARQIAALVRQYKQANPRAEILVAMEALSVKLNGKAVPALTEENLSLEWLKANAWGATFQPYIPLTQEGGVTLLPLEDREKLSAYGKELEGTYAKSPAGLEDRNRAWAARVEQERKRKILQTGEDYDLILVVAGEAHVRYTFPNALPLLMKEKRSAVVDLTLRNVTLFSNYFWDKLPGRAELRIVPPQCFIVKTTDSKTARLLGADVYINTPL